jgi:hypothetical protein
MHRFRLIRTCAIVIWVPSVSHKIVSLFVQEQSATISSSSSSLPGHAIHIPLEVHDGYR